MGTNRKKPTVRIWDKKTLDFQEGQLILIDKPYEWTSFDVVKKVRYQIKKKLGLKKIKVGHAGTLDPLATGLLILATGRYTKKIEEIMGFRKEYSGTILLGASTPSYDLETEINVTVDNQDLTKDKVKSAAQKLTGEIDQIPPIFSAKKVNGVRAYELARAGKEVELKSKRIFIEEFKTEVSLPEVHFNITCSKGTYIRSMARDLGLELDNAGHLTALRRESIGEFSVTDAITVEEFSDLMSDL